MAVAEHDVRRLSSLAFVVSGFLGVLLWLMSKGLMLFAIMFSLAPVIAMFMSDRRKVFALTLFASVAALGVPGIRINSTSMAMLLQVAVLGLFVQDFLMHSKEIPRSDGLNILIFIFIGNLILTASIRGFGLYQLGGDMIGGMQYIQIILSFLFLWYLRTIVWTPKQVRRLFIFLAIGSLIPFVIQMAVVSFQGLLPLADFFVFSSARVASAIQDVEQGKGGRYETVVNLSYFLICVGVILNSNRKWWALSLAFLGVILLMLSGFRRYSVLSVFVLVASSVMLSKNRVRSFIIWGIAGMAGIILIYSIVGSLPFNVQRSLSFLPGIGVDEYAMRSGEGSFEWRMDVYRFCMEEIPQYLMLGKGMLLTLEETMYSLSYREFHGMDPFYVFFTHNYHNGFFELILDFGVVGFLSFLLFTTVYLNKIWKHIRKYRDDSATWAIIVTTWVVCVALVSDYFLVRGEFSIFLAPFLIFFGTMILAYNAHLADIQSNLSEPAAEKEDGLSEV
ncbi:O-antigen ligase family protein [Pontiellaceae bacterium B1224]|nr:O-antigen ligase family protein [Pontiellaceae bacterium B1224]